MARRSTDLLDMFRGPRAGEHAAKGRSGKPRKKPRKRTKTRGRGGWLSAFEGLVLGPRQVLLASCVMVLLLVLAFTVGLGVGRRGGPLADSTSLSLESGTGRPAAAFYIQGRVPRRDLLRDQDVDPDLLKEDLVRLHGFRPADLQVTEGERGFFFVHYGPFTSEEAARRVLREHNLGYLNVQGTWPFSLEEIVRVDR